MAILWNKCPRRFNFLSLNRVFIFIFLFKFLLFWNCFPWIYSIFVCFFLKAFCFFFSLFYFKTLFFYHFIIYIIFFNTTVGWHLHTCSVSLAGLCFPFVIICFSYNLIHQFCAFKMMVLQPYIFSVLFKFSHIL